MGLCSCTGGNKKSAQPKPKDAGQTAQQKVEAKPKPEATPAPAPSPAADPAPTTQQQPPAAAQTAANEPQVAQLTSVPCQKDGPGIPPKVSKSATGMKKFDSSKELQDKAPPELSGCKLFEMRRQQSEEASMVASGKVDTSKQQGLSTSTRTAKSGRDGEKESSRRTDGSHPEDRKSPDAHNLGTARSEKAAEAAGEEPAAPAEESKPEPEEQDE